MLVLASSPVTGLLLQDIVVTTSNGLDATVSELITACVVTGAMHPMLGTDAHVIARRYDFVFSQLKYECHYACVSSCWLGL